MDFMLSLIFFLKEISRYINISKLLNNKNSKKTKKNTQKVSTLVRLNSWLRPWLWASLIS